MMADVQTLAARYRAKGILLDTNLLLLLLVGLAGEELVNEFKRTQNQGFTEKEFFLLAGIVRPFSKIVTTTHILTETSNYIFQHKGKSRQAILEIAKNWIQSFKERRPESRALVQSGAFLDFGLTDAAILDLPPKRYLVFSVDAALVIALQKKGVDAVNFNHVRQLSWQE